MIGWKGRTEIAGIRLTSDMNDPEGVPYFLWDRPETLGHLRERLARVESEERVRILARILREARDTDVWHFITPGQLVRQWEVLSPLLGRRRAFWKWLLDMWREEGIVTD